MRARGRTRDTVDDHGDRRQRDVHAPRAGEGFLARALARGRAHAGGEPTQPVERSVARLLGSAAGSAGLARGLLLSQSLPPADDHLVRRLRGAHKVAMQREQPAHEHAAAEREERVRHQQDQPRGGVARTAPVEGGGAFRRREQQRDVDRQQPARPGGQREEQQQEGAIVGGADARLQVVAVVVEAVHALAALVAVLRPRPARHVARAVPTPPQPIARLLRPMLRVVVHRIDTQQPAVQADEGGMEQRDRDRERPWGARRDERIVTGDEHTGGHGGIEAEYSPREIEAAVSATGLQVIEAAARKCEPALHGTLGHGGATSAQHLQPWRG